MIEEKIVLCSQYIYVIKYNKLPEQYDIWQFEMFQPH